MATYRVTGNTYEVRDVLRKLGGKFDKETKSWKVEIRERGMDRNDAQLHWLKKQGCTCTKIS